MKTHTCTAALIAIATAFLAFCGPARAQGNAQEAADMLRALNIQIGEAQQAGDRARVSQLQNRYLDIQKKWGVRPSEPPRKKPVYVPVPVSTAWTSTQNGSGKITGYKGGPIHVRRASVYVPEFWGPARQPNEGGRGVVLKFTDTAGNVFTYKGNWSYRGNLAVSLRVDDGEGGNYTGTFTMAPGEGLSTVSLVGQRGAEGYNVSFSN